MQAFRFLDKYSDNYSAFIKKVWWVEHLYSVAIGNPEWHMRKASHCGSKQEYRSCSKSLFLLLTRSTHTYFCSSRTSRSWWTTQSTQHPRRGCENSNVKAVHFIHYRLQNEAEFGDEDHITRLPSQWMLHCWR